MKPIQNWLCFRVQSYVPHVNIYETTFNGRN